MKGANSATRSSTPTGRVRQPGPSRRLRRRRRGSEDGAARRVVALEQFLNPVTDGAVLPILHFNGFKIANPTVLARISREKLESLFFGYGYAPFFVEGRPRGNSSKDGGNARSGCVGDRPDPGRRARHEDRARPTLADDRASHSERLDGPKEVDGRRWKARTDRTRSDRGSAENPAHLRLLEKWMRSYPPEELSTSAAASWPSSGSCLPGARAE